MRGEIVPVFVMNSLQNRALNTEWLSGHVYIKVHSGMACSIMALSRFGPGSFESDDESQKPPRETAREAAESVDPSHGTDRR